MEDAAVFAHRVSLHLFYLQAGVYPLKTKSIRFILFLATISAVFFLIYCNIFQSSSLSGGSDGMLMLRAREVMRNAMQTLKSEAENRGIAIDRITDPNETGLIGLDYSPITTTLGHLEAKRSSVNPDSAAMICGILLGAGLKPGDSVAIGSSASFPGFLIATLSACKVLELNPMTFISVGASQYGANNPDFTLIDQMETLEKAFGKYFSVDAVSTGGNNDIADDLDPETQALILEKIRKSGYRLISEPDFVKNVQLRMALYDELKKNPVKLFINIGGAEANMGTSFEVLNLEPGLNQKIEKIPPENERGVIYEFARRGTDVLHLLYVKGLCLRYGLSWDPVPFTDESYKSLIFFHEGNDNGFVIFYIFFIACIFGTYAVFKFLK